MSILGNDVGRRRLPAELKKARGTLRPSRERPRRRTRRRTVKATRISEPSRDFATLNADYMAGVVSGDIITGKWARLAVERHRRDLDRAASDPAWPYVFSQKHADAVCRFIERLPHVEGAWATKTITLLPWQVFFLSALFGWRQRATGRRRFTSAYFESGRKSAKSTLSAGIALFHLLHEDEPGASVICGASTGEQARIVFGIAQRMLRRAAWLRDAGLQVWAHSITFEAAGASMRPVNAKSSTLDGLNPSLIVLDESHAQDFSLHDVLRSSQGSRLNPLILAPTTAGYDLNSVGFALRQTTEKVLQSVFEADHQLGVIFAADEGDEWRDERTWKKANPGLGTTPTLEWVRQYATDAEQTPGLQGEFRTKICSEWLQSATTWLDMAKWDKCADPTARIDAFRGARCWLGMDLAARDDLAALAFLFEKDGYLYGFTRCYLPELVVSERARAVPAYRQWADAGLLVLTSGDLIDFAVIEADLRAACKTYSVQDIAADQFGSVQLISALSESGLPARIESKNAKTFTGPATELEARIRAGRFRHDGNHLLKWCASNVVVTRRVDDSLIPKKVSGESPQKIDAIDALCLAIGGWLRQPAPKRSVYSDRGILVL